MPSTRPPGSCCGARPAARRRSRRAWPSARCRRPTQAQGRGADRASASRRASRPPTSPAKPGCRTCRSRRRARHRAALATSPSCSSTARDRSSTPGCPTRRAACSTCAPATAAWRCSRRWPIRRSRSTRPTSRADALEAGRASTSTRHELDERITRARVRPVREPARPLRPDPLQPALRQRRRAWRRCRPNTAPSPRWRWPAAPTAWT